MVLIDCKNYKRAHDALHKLWCSVPHDANYDKSAWMELEAAINVLAHDGPGSAAAPPPKETKP